MKIRIVSVRKNHDCDLGCFLQNSKCVDKIKKGQTAVLIEWNRTQNMRRDYDPKATNHFRLHISCYRKLLSGVSSWPALESIDGFDKLCRENQGFLGFA